MEKRAFGYVRVSSTDQNEGRQLITMERLGVPQANIFVDKQSGKDFDRPKYLKMIKKLKEGDVLYIQSIDRLGRNYEEIQKQWQLLTKKIKIDIVVVDMPLLDTRVGKDLLGTFIADLVLQILSFTAHNEREVIKKRQIEGIAAAKARGVRFGRPMVPLSTDFFKCYEEWKKEEITGAEAARRCGMTNSAFRYRVKIYEENKECPKKQITRLVTPLPASFLKVYKEWKKERISGIEAARRCGMTPAAFKYRVKVHEKSEESSKRQNKRPTTSLPANSLKNYNEGKKEEIIGVETARKYDIITAASKDYEENKESLNGLATLSPTNFLKSCKEEKKIGAETVKKSDVTTTNSKENKESSKKKEVRQVTLSSTNFLKNCKEEKKIGMETMKKSDVTTTNSKENEESSKKKEVQQVTVSPTKFLKVYREWKKEKISGAEAARRCGINPASFRSRVKTYEKNKKSLKKQWGQSKTLLSPKFIRLYEEWKKEKIPGVEVARRCGITVASFKYRVKIYEENMEELKKQVEQTTTLPSPKFLKIYKEWKKEKISRAEAARKCGISSVTFKKRAEAYEESKEELKKQVKQTITISSSKFLKIYKEWKKEKISGAEAARRCGISPATFKKRVKAYEESKESSKKQGGRPVTPPSPKFIKLYKEWKKEKISGAEAARRCGISPATFKKRAKVYEESKESSKKQNLAE